MARKFSVMSLLSNLTNSAPPPPVLDEKEAERGRVNTTLRLEPDVRKYVEDQAEHFGVSTQQFISMMLKGLMCGNSHEMVHQTNLMESRIYDLFARHNLTPVQVARMLSSFGVTSAVLKDPREMLSLITSEVIEFLTVKFSVRRGWINGKDDEIFEVVNFDGAGTGFIQRILEMKDATDKIKIHFIIEDGYQPLTDEGSLGWAEFRGDAGFVIEVKGGEEDVTRYLIAHPQPWGYKRTRMEMKLILMFLEKGGKNNFTYPVRNYQGWLLADEKFKALFSGRVWPGDILQFRSPGVKTGIDARMYLEDMVDEDGHALEEFEVDEVAERYNSSKFPLIHQAYRELHTIDPDKVSEYLYATDEARAAMKDELMSRIGR